MRFELEDGKKGMGADGIPDQKIWVRLDRCRCGSRELLTLCDLGFAYVYWWDNEERLFPSFVKGYRGGDKVLQFLRDCRALGVEASCSKHGLLYVAKQLELA